MRKLHWFFTVPAIFSLSCVSAFAAKPVNKQAVNNIDGFYMGAGLGMFNARADNDFFTNSMKDLSTTLSLSTGSAQGLLGYGQQIGSGYVGAEVAYRYVFANGDGTENPDPGEVDVKHFAADNTFSFSLRGGFFAFPNILMYCALGVGYTQFSFDTRDTQGTLRQTKHWEPGVLPGIGMQVNLQNHLSLDVRYTYGFYQGSSTKSSTAVGSIETKLDNPQVNTTDINLVYHFV
jgi:opacity protein-like surface antigen